MTAPDDPFRSPPEGWRQSPPPDANVPPYGAPGGPAAPYGQPHGQPHGQPYGQSGAGRPRNGLGIGALVLGVLGLLLSLFVVGGLLGLVAVVLGFLGLGRVRRGEATNKGMAITGIVTGLLAVLISVLVVVGVAQLFGSEEFSNFTECVQQASSQEEVDACAQQFGEQVNR